nr:hypothetical protein Iba_chr12cCG11980 [Ipomoea batatas]
MCLCSCPSGCFRSSPVFGPVFRLDPSFLDSLPLPPLRLLPQASPLPAPLPVLPCYALRLLLLWRFRPPLGARAFWSRLRLAFCTDSVHSLPQPLSPCPLPLFLPLWRGWLLGRLFFFLHGSSPFLRPVFPPASFAFVSLPVSAPLPPFPVLLPWPALPPSGPRPCPWPLVPTRLSCVPLPWAGFAPRLPRPPYLSRPRRVAKPFWFPGPCGMPASFPPASMVRPHVPAFFPALPITSIHTLCPRRLTRIDHRSRAPRRPLPTLGSPWLPVSFAPPRFSLLCVQPLTVLLRGVARPLPPLLFPSVPGIPCPGCVFSASPAAPGPALLLRFPVICCRFLSALRAPWRFFRFAVPPPPPVARFPLSLPASPSGSFPRCCSPCPSFLADRWSPSVPVWFLAPTFPAATLLPSLRCLPPFVWPAPSAAWPPRRRVSGGSSILCPPLGAIIFFRCFFPSFVVLPVFPLFGPWPGVASLPISPCLLCCLVSCCCSSLPAGFSLPARFFCPLLLPEDALCGSPPSRALLSPALFGCGLAQFV